MLNTASHAHTHYSLLKGTSLKTPIHEALLSARNQLLDVILSDVSCERGAGELSQLVPHALQTLGYLLYNEQLARYVSLSIQ